MAWVVKFTRDTETKNLGTLSAFNDNFRYERRANSGDQADLDAFVDEAKAKFAGVTIEKTELSTIEAAVLAALVI